MLGSYRLFPQRKRLFLSKMYFLYFQKILKFRKNVRRLNVIRSEKKNTKTRRNPQKRAKAWHAALLGTKHYIFARLSRNFFFVCVKVRFTRFSVLLPKKTFFVEQRREVFKVFFLYLYNECCNNK